MTSATLVEPAYLWVPEHTSTAGGEVADLADALDIHLDPEQRMVLDAALAEKPNGRWAALETAVIAPRQNVKSLAYELICIADLWLDWSSSLIVWTAHEFSTAEETRRHVNDLIENHDFLRRRVHKIVEANGEEGIELLGGKRLRFKARTKTGGRGLTGDRIVLDEGFHLQPAHMGSLLPTLSGKSMRGNPQIMYASSAGMVTSAVLRRIRDRGRAGGDTSLSYIEWGAPPTACESDRCAHLVGTEGCALDDRDLWQRANLALNRDRPGGISYEFIETERRSMPPNEFARERLTWWEDPEETTSGLDLATWDECRDADSKLISVDAWAVATARDLSWSAIAVAGRRDDGLAHVEVVEYRKGTSWVADRLVELQADHGDAPTFMEAKGPRSSLADDLAEVEISVNLLSSDDMVGACGQLYDDLLRRTVRHIGQPELDVSVRGAQRRLVGDAWVWSRAASMLEISPLVATTVVLWGARQGEHGPSVYEARGLRTL